MLVVYKGSLQDVPDTYGPKHLHGAHFTPNGLYLGCPITNPYILLMLMLIDYRIVPNSHTLPNKGSPYGLRKAKTDVNEQNCPKILNN